MTGSTDASTIMLMVKKKSTALGKRLEAIRNRRELTQKDAAAILKVNVKTWNNWENGREVPTPPLMLLIDLLDKDII